MTPEPHLSDIGLTVHDDRYCHWLSRFFFVPGYDVDDLYQEAALAMWLARERSLRRLAAYRRIVELLRRSQRGGRPTFCELVDIASAADVADIVEARERLREVIAAPLSALERTALGRAVRGEGCTEKTLDNALSRARRKLAA